MVGKSNGMGIGGTCKSDDGALGLYTEITFMTYLVLRVSLQSTWIAELSGSTRFPSGSFQRHDYDIAAVTA